LVRLQGSVADEVCSGERLMGIVPTTPAATRGLGDVITSVKHSSAVIIFALMLYYARRTEQGILIAVFG
jgi:hypothetical protein